MFVNVLKALLLSIFIADSRAHRGYWTAYSSGTAKCPAHNTERWTYDEGHNGPSTWGESHPDCYGSKQSPIDIISTNAKEDANLEELYLLDYDTPISKAKIENNGHSIEIAPQDDVVRQIVVDGDLYKLHQFHFHWGSNYSTGSEHAIDGKKYAMEMHFVHLNENHKIAVVGVFFQEQSTDNQELQKIVDELQGVQYKKSEAKMECSLNLEKLLPRNPTSFYRYVGSLTTPGCAEGVIWSVIPEPIPVGRNQMRVFREKLYSTKKEDSKESCKLVDNYRPLQPLNDRQVSRSATV